MTDHPPSQAHGPSFDSDEIAARYGFERQIIGHLRQLERPVVTASMTEEYQRLIRDCYIMKAALFNAAKRLERKHAAGQFTFALSGIYGFLVPLFALQFEPFLTALVTNIVSFTAATAGAISFVVAMIYQQQDLGRLARDYHDGGLKMNKLRRQLKISPLTSAEQLRQSIHAYDDILVNCHNHEEIDFEFAKLGARPANNTEGQLDRWMRRRRLLDLRALFETYRLLAAVWIVPPAIGVAIWLFLSNAAPAISQIAR